jgi:hypothetical protein
LLKRKKANYSLEFKPETPDLLDFALLLGIAENAQLSNN